MQWKWTHPFKQSHSVECKFWVMFSRGIFISPMSTFHTLSKLLYKSSAPCAPQIHTQCKCSLDTVYFKCRFPQIHFWYSFVKQRAVSLFFTKTTQRNIQHFLSICLSVIFIFALKLMIQN